MFIVLIKQTSRDEVRLRAVISAGAPVTFPEAWIMTAAMTRAVWLTEKQAATAFRAVHSEHQGLVTAIPQGDRRIEGGWKFG